LHVFRWEFYRHLSERRNQLRVGKRTQISSRNHLEIAQTVRKSATARDRSVEAVGVAIATWVDADVMMEKETLCPRVESGV
jgi:hypothetical protein